MPNIQYDKSARLGLVGLGIMGAPMAQRLAEQGFSVVAWNLEPERYDLVKQDRVQWADSAAEVFAQSDVAMICVLGDAALESVVFGEKGFAAAEKGAGLIIDFSTSSPSATLELGPRAKKELGADWIDAPMSGGPQAAREGNLTLMIGGDEAVCDAAKPILEALGSNITRMGPLGAGQKTKILNQAIVGVNYVLMAELLAICKAAGVDPKLLPGCLKGGMADSTILQRIFSQMAAEDFDPPRAYARQLHKDLKAVAGFIDELKLDLPVLDTGIHQYADFTEAGNEMADAASVSRLYEKK